ncbi:MAG: methyltransferase domain-containing protein [Chloroflexi bacterium]|nr:methyltransferase domain-containing protein [Chloroflexota bacterium]
MDTGQYAMGEIAKYEAVYGRNFISPGGLDTAREFAALLALEPGMRVLDAGCGLGGGALYMAEQYGVCVHGLDLSANMIALAQVRCGAERVTFEQADLLDYDGAAAYDRVYSRDVFLHIHDKARLMQAVRRCLKPGGLLLFTDYCRGDPSTGSGPSAEFAAYIRQRQYALCTVAGYRGLLEQAGFGVIVAEDRTPQFIQILETEQARLPSLHFSASTLAELQRSWQSKIARARRGEQRWGLFLARRADDRREPMRGLV